MLFTACALLSLTSWTPRPAASPPNPVSAGPEIVFVSQNGDELWVMNADGSGKTRILRKSKSYCFSPSWSPDGAEIAFAARINGSRGIWIVGADGSNLRQILALPANQVPMIWLSWSPAPVADGSHRIAYSDVVDTPFGGVWLVRSDGSAAVHLAGQFWKPEWAPDGQRLAVSAGGVTVLSVGLSGAQLTVTGSTTLWSGPAEGMRWANDGDRIAFSTLDSGGRYDVAWVDAALPLGPIHFATSTPDRDEQWLGGFAPDDSRVTYSYRVGATYGVYASALSGSSATLLATKATYSSWRRP